MYYGYRCYSRSGKPLGWFYIPSAYEITWTEDRLHICKKWKKQKTAEKYFAHYNARWQSFSKGGHLQIEVMPEFTEPNSESPQERRHKFLEMWGDDDIPDIISFTPTSEIMEWLNSERGESESDEDLINRKLQKLLKLEREGY